MNKKTLVLFALIFPLLTVGAGCLWQKTENQIKAPLALTIDTEEETKISYINSQYGFSLELPNTWKNYVTKNRTLDWGTGGTSDSVDFGFSAQDSLFNISIFTKNQWKKIKSEEGPTPTYLGENSQNIFGFAVANGAPTTDEIIERMKEIKDIVQTFKIITPEKLSTSLTYYIFNRLDSRTNFCDGVNMNSAGYKALLTKKVTQIVPGILKVEEKIKTTLSLAAEADSFSEIFTRTASTTIENGLVTMYSANGWAGSSIFYCRWKPFVEKNLEQFPEVKQIKWALESQNE